MLGHAVFFVYLYTWQTYCYTGFGRKWTQVTGHDWFVTFVLESEKLTLKAKKTNRY